jgi:hypothetical protein
VIVDVEATPARTYDEVAATKTMLDRTEACFDLKPMRLAAARPAPCRDSGWRSGSPTFVECGKILGDRARLALLVGPIEHWPPARWRRRRSFRP